MKNDFDAKLKVLRAVWAQRDGVANETFEMEISPKEIMRLSDEYRARGVCVVRRVVDGVEKVYEVSNLRPTLVESVYVLEGKDCGGLN